MVFLYLQVENGILNCNTNKKNPKIFSFTDPKFFELPEISGVGRVEANKP